MSEMFPERQVIPQDPQMRAYIEAENWTAAAEREAELIAEATEE